MKKFWSRLGYAFTGLQVFFKSDDNGRIHLGFTVLVLLAGSWLKISKAEMLAVLLCIGLVISLEMLNAAIEKLCDRVHPQKHDEIRNVKDVAAGAVLWAAIISAIVGLIIFVPKLITKFNELS